MDAVPVRCPHCGCLSIAGLLIPSSISIEEFRALPVKIADGPVKCPLCKTILNDDATRLTEAIYAVLRDAKLNQTESSALLNALTQCRLGKSPHSVIINTIEETSPKAAGLKRFIPPGDVTGALALLIAILSFTNDSVFDWVAPNLSKPGGGAGEHNSTGRESPRWIKISSFKLHGEKPSSSAAGYLYPLNGTWEAGQGCHLWIAIYDSNKIFEMLVSTTPGTWGGIELASSPRGKSMFALYISTSDGRNPLGTQRALEMGILHLQSRSKLKDKPLDMQRASEMALLPFQLSLESRGVARVRPVAIERFIEWFNSYLEWPNRKPVQLWHPRSHGNI